MDDWTIFVGAVSLVTGIVAAVALIAAFFVGGDAFIPAFGFGFWSLAFGTLYAVFKQDQL